MPYGSPPPSSFGSLSGSPTDNAALAAALALKLDKAGGTMTGALAVAAGSTTSAALSASQTWNSGGTTCQGLLLEITDTASAAASLAACLKVGSTSVFEVSKSGDLASDGAAYTQWTIGRSTGNRTLYLRGGGGGNIALGSAASVQLAGGVPLWCRSAASIIGVPRNGSYQFGDTDGDFTGTAGCTILSGSGSPESVRTAKVGSIYLRQDGGASTTLYVKESGTGNTGWIAK